MVDPPAVMLRPLTAADLPVVERWFLDAETQRWLGPTSWPGRLLDLCTVETGRFAYLAVWEGAVAGLVDVDRYDDGRAAVALVVAPEHRRRGVGGAIMSALAARPELADVVEFFGGVERGNVASAALVAHAGCEAIDDVADEDGFTHFAIRRGGRSVQRRR